MARLSFTFLILAGLCAYEAWQINTGRRGVVPTWRGPAFIAAAVVLVLLSLLGARERHRPDK
jgi:hypothetical protein